MKLKSNIITLAAIAFLQLIASCEKVDLSDDDDKGPEVEILPMDSVAYNGTVEVAPIDTISDILNENEELPQVPFAWNGHAVVYAETDNEGIDLLLLSQWEYNSVPSYYHPTDSLAALAIARDYVEDNLSGWRIPTDFEGEMMSYMYSPEDWRANLNKLLDMPMIARDGGSNVYYLCEFGKMKYSISPTINTISQAGAKTKYSLRLVKKIRLTNSK